MPAPKKKILIKKVAVKKASANASSKKTYSKKHASRKVGKKDAHSVGFLDDSVSGHAVFDSVKPPKPPRR